jgi:hypothetical protein
MDLVIGLHHTSVPFPFYMIHGENISYLKTKRESASTNKARRTQCHHNGAGKARRDCSELHYNSVPQRQKVVYPLQ